MIDRHSQTWADVERFVKAEMAAAAGALGTHGVDLAVTEFLRGRLAILAAILQLPNMKPTAPVVEDTNYGISDAAD